MRKEQVGRAGRGIRGCHGGKNITSEIASIVIATAERPGIVLDCLRCLKEQVPPEVQVVIVDAGRDAPVDEAAVKAAWPNTLLIHSDVMNAGSQRNEGVRRAAHELIIFLDDDCFIQPGWWPAIIEPLLRRDEGGNLKPEGGGEVTTDGADGEKDEGRRAPGRSAMAEKLPPEEAQVKKKEISAFRSHPSSLSKGIGAVAGAVWCNPSPTFTKKRGGYVNWRGEPIQITHRGEGVQEFCDWPMTTNMAVRKSVVEAIGGVPSVYGVYDEDVDLGLKICRAGWRIAYVPQAAVYHYYRERAAKPITKRSEYLLGRNRSILLVRHYGVSLRLICFLLVTPWIQMGKALWRIWRSVVSHLGHAAAYIVGMLRGLVVGTRNPVDRDEL